MNTTKVTIEIPDNILASLKNSFKLGKEIGMLKADITFEQFLSLIFVKGFELQVSFGNYIEQQEGLTGESPQEYFITKLKAKVSDNTKPVNN